MIRTITYEYFNSSSTVKPNRGCGVYSRYGRNGKNQGAFLDADLDIYPIPGESGSFFLKAH